MIKLYATSFIAILPLLFLSGISFADYEVRLPTGAPASVSSSSGPVEPAEPEFTPEESLAAWEAFYNFINRPIPTWSGAMSLGNLTVNNQPSSGPSSSAGYFPNEPYPASDIAGNADVRQFSKATHVDFLSSLRTIDGYLQFFGHDKLLNVNGLSGLTSVSGRILMTSNPLLSDISGLRNLTHVGVAVAVGSKSGSGGIWISNQAYTVKSPLGSPLCNAIAAGAITINPTPNYDVVLAVDGLAIMCQ